MSIELNNESELIQGILNHGIDIVDNCLVSFDFEKYLERINLEKLSYPIPNKINTEKWFCPESYQNMDIEEYLVNLCPEENYERLIIELKEYRQRNLLPLLKQMKYIIDTLRANQIVWGVGRGSSVASYVLFLLGVHKIDSVKYNLPLEEFFKGGENGQSN